MMMTLLTVFHWQGRLTGVEPPRPRKPSLHNKFVTTELILFLYHPYGVLLLRSLIRFLGTGVRI